MCCKNQKKCVHVFYKPLPIAIEGRKWLIITIPECPVANRKLWMYTEIHIQHKVTIMGTDISSAICCTEGKVESQTPTISAICNHARPVACPLLEKL